MVDNRIYIYISGYTESSRKRQPWYTVRFLSDSLSKKNQNVIIIDKLHVDLDQSENTIIICTSFKNLFHRLKFKNAKIIYLSTFPIFPKKFLKNIRFVTLFNHFTEFWKILVATLLPLYFLKRAYGSSTVITYTDYSENILQSVGIATLRLVPFIDDIFENKTVEQSQEKKLNIGYLGPPYLSRCPDILLNAAVELQEKSDKLSFHFILRTENEKCKSLAKKFIEKSHLKNVTVIEGVLDRTTLTKYFEKIDVFFLPFELVMSELPIVVLEALRQNKIVLTSSVSGVSDLFNGSAGYRRIGLKLINVMEELENIDGISSVNTQNIFKNINYINEETIDRIIRI